MDPYKILGVERKSTQEQISKAYRTLATKYHPDRNPDNASEAAAKFKEVTAAFEMIGDEEKRRYFDFYGNQVPSFSFRNRNTVDDVFDNIFGSVFGNQKRGPAGSKIRVKITLQEAFRGCEKTVSSEGHKFCDPCKGTGSSSWEPCQKCSGRGFVLTGNGHIKVQSSCAHCSGRGAISTKKCESCHGKGYEVDQVKQIVVKIPPGVDDGNQIRLAGEGADGSDLFVTVNVEKDLNFTRDDKFLIGKLEVPYHTLVKGGLANMDFFGSQVTIRIPPRTPAGSRMRIKGQGMPMLYNSEVRGDLIVDIRLRIPSSLTKEHEKLLDELAKLDV